MKKKPLLIFTLLTTLLLSYTPAHSELIQARKTSISSRNAMSAWTQPKGSLYNQLSYSYHKSTNKFTTLRTNSGGNIISFNNGAAKADTDKFTASIVTYHAEYGITDSLTAFATIPWIDMKYALVQIYSDSDSLENIGDINLGLRYKLTDNLLDSGAVTSIQGSLKIPEAYDYGDPVTQTSLGEGQYDASIDILTGKEYEKGYLIFNAGYVFRFENEETPYKFRPSDQIRALIGGGYRIMSGLTISGTLDWTKSIGNASVSNELINHNRTVGGGMNWHQDNVLIKDDLMLEQDILNAGIALAYKVTDKIEAILRYNTDIEGMDGFGSKNTRQVSTYTAALTAGF